MSIDHQLNSPIVSNSKSITLKIPTLRKFEKRRSSQDVVNQKLTNPNQDNLNLEIFGDESRILL